jgi:hypothetical protein
MGMINLDLPRNKHEILQLYIPAEVEDEHVLAHGQLNERDLLRFPGVLHLPGVLDVQADELHPKNRLVDLKPLLVLLKDAFHLCRIIGVDHIDLRGAMGNVLELLCTCYMVVLWDNVVGRATIGAAQSGLENLAWFHRGRRREMATVVLGNEEMV